MNEWGYRNFGNTNKEEETMNRQQVIKALKDMAKALASEGTTTFLATTMTQSPENISKALIAVKDIMEKGEFKGAEVIGVHLEGPFISTKHIGAQPLDYVASPSVEIFKNYLIVFRVDYTHLYLRFYEA